MNKAVMIIALCTGLVQAQDAINIDLNIENNNKAEVDIVIEQLSASSASLNQGRGYTIASWPFLKIPANTSVKADSFSYSDDGSLFRVHAFKAKELEGDDLLLAYIKENSITHLGTVECKVSGTYLTTLSCTADQSLNIKQSQGYDGYQLDIQINPEKDASNGSRYLG